jgi:PAS domain S-box-containing protein
MSKSQTIVDVKLRSYLKSTLYARWIIIFIVIASFWFLPNIHRKVVYVLIVLAVSYNLGLQLERRLRRKPLISRAVTLVIDTILTIVLTISSGNVNSPYLAIFPIILVSGVFWYGNVWAMVIAVMEALPILGYYYLKTAQPAFPKTFIVQMLLFITVGLYIGMLSKTERSERGELLALESEVENERKQLLTLINNLGDAIFVVNTKGIVALFNHMASEIVGQDQILNKSIKDLLAFKSVDDKDEKFDLKQLVSTHEREDLRLKVPDGSYMNVSLSMAPYIVDGQHKGYVLIIRDITKDKTIEQERSEFIAVAAHELRTPLTIAEGDVSFLLSPPYLPADPQAVHMLNGAMRSLTQLSHIINDLTNLSRVDSEQLDVKVEPLNPMQLLEELKADFSDQAKAKGLSIVTEFDPSVDVPATLTSRYVVQEILITLISNAIKFTEQGVITLALVRPKDKPDGVTFCVRDTGIGISYSDQKKIFQKFFLSEDYMTRIHGGTGLGLYIAKKLADRLTGSLWFETDLGKGSAFYLWIPPYSRDRKDQAEVAPAEAKEFFNNV